MPVILAFTERTAWPKAVLVDKSVFLPKEHGSWSLAFEPVLLGLLLAPSWAGAAFATAVAAGFFARRPLKAVFVALSATDRRATRAVLALWAALALVGLVEAAILGGLRPLWPVVLIVPFGLFFARYDALNQARATVAELAGSAAFSVVPAVMALLAGQTVLAALVLVVLALARGTPAVLAVRSYLRSAKGGPPRPWPALIASGLACAALVALTGAGLLPGTAVVLGFLLFARTIWLAGPWRPVWPARRIGQLEAGLGVLYIALLGFSWY